jgi:hypothetical protein
VVILLTKVRACKGYYYDRLCGASRTSLFADNNKGGQSLNPDSRG